MTLGSEPYDFIDFGASKGGCIDFARQRLGGRRGLGIDLTAEKVALMRAHGYECIRADVTRLPFREKSLRFVTMSHILEHLPSLDSVQAAIRSAAHAARDFLFIQGPYFDADDFLQRYGLRFFWSYWRGHTCHVKSWELTAILHRLALTDYVLFTRQPVLDSNHSSIHPTTSPINQFEYDPAIHPPKPMVRFSPPLYREIVCYVRLREFGSWPAVVQARKGCVPMAGNEYHVRAIQRT